MTRLRGFNLIELMITVAVVGILAAIALPSYRVYVERTNRSVAKTALNEIVSRQESHYVERKRYALTLSALGYDANTLYLDREGALLGASSGGAIYAVNLAGNPSSTSCPPGGAATRSGFTVTAQPINAQASDTRCATLCLSSTSVKGASGAASDCWSR